MLFVRPLGKDAKMNLVNSKKTMNVSVHLAFGLGAKTWQEKYKNGLLLGLNEPLAYGYHRAEEFGCTVVYSEDKDESKLEKFVRKSARRILKFDFIHAWRNRKNICEADIVWTHTEWEHLAILMLFRVINPSRKPKLIAQSVWLFDRWSHFSWIHRWLFSRLLARADIITVLSPENLRVARQLFPNVRSELVLFGCNADHFTNPRKTPLNNPVRLISLGNDQHRDWETLIEAIKNLDGYELKIASQKINPKLVENATNIRIIQPKSNLELFDLYKWADIFVLMLKPNLHASGVTVLQEATLQGLPVVCSDTGGLKAYFSDKQIKYVPTQNIEALKLALLDLVENQNKRWSYAESAQSQMGPEGLSSYSYVRRHVELSYELLFAWKAYAREKAY